MLKHLKMIGITSVIAYMLILAIVVAAIAIVLFAMFVAHGLLILGL